MPANGFASTCVLGGVPLAVGGSFPKIQPLLQWK